MSLPNTVRLDGSVHLERRTETPISEIELRGFRTHNFCEGHRSTDRAKLWVYLVTIVAFKDLVQVSGLSIAMLQFPEIKNPSPPLIMVVGCVSAFFVPFRNGLVMSSNLLFIRSAFA
jgi:hypothetical protein